MNDVSPVKVVETQRHVMYLNVGQPLSQLQDKTYHSQSIASWITINVLQRVTVLEIWHHNERSLVQNVGTIKS